MNRSYYEPLVRYHENMSVEELKSLALQLRRDTTDLTNFAVNSQLPMSWRLYMEDILDWIRKT